MKNLPMRLPIRLSRPFLTAGLFASVLSLTVVGYGATIIFPAISRGVAIRTRLEQVTAELQTRAAAREVEIKTQPKNLFERRLASRAANRGKSDLQIVEERIEQERHEGNLSSEHERLLSELEIEGEKNRHGAQYLVIGLLGFVPGVLLITFGLVTGLLSSSDVSDRRPPKSTDKTTS